MGLAMPASESEPESASLAYSFPVRTDDDDHRGSDNESDNNSLHIPPRSRSPGTKGRLAITLDTGI